MIEFNGLIWALSDSEKKGVLTQTGLYKALKFIAIAQAGKPANASFLNSSNYHINLVN